MKSVGLTGGIGSGKTEVANHFIELGVPVINADDIAAELTKPGQESYDSIVRYFGKEILNPEGIIDRALLREVIFKGAEKREWLEQLLHPAICEQIQNTIIGIRAPYCVVEIPLLVETGADDLVDRVLVVDVAEAVQIERTCQRDGISEDAVKVIMKTQVSRDQRLELADDIIDNQSELTDLHLQVDSLHKKYLDMSRMDD